MSDQKNTPSAMMRLRLPRSAHQAMGYRQGVEEREDAIEPPYGGIPHAQVALHGLDNYGDDLSVNKGNRSR